MFLTNPMKCTGTPCGGCDVPGVSAAILTARVLHGGVINFIPVGIDDEPLSDRLTPARVYKFPIIDDFPPGEHTKTLMSYAACCSHDILTGCGRRCDVSGNQGPCDDTHVFEAVAVIIRALVYYLYASNARTGVPIERTETCIKMLSRMIMMAKNLCRRYQDCAKLYKAACHLADSPDVIQSLIVSGLIGYQPTKSILRSWMSQIPDQFGQNCMDPYVSHTLTCLTLVPYAFGIDINRVLDEVDYFESIVPLNVGPSGASLDAVPCNIEPYPNVVLASSTHSMCAMQVPHNKFTLTFEPMGLSDKNAYFLIYAGNSGGQTSYSATSDQNVCECYLGISWLMPLDICRRNQTIYVIQNHVILSMIATSNDDPVCIAMRGCYVRIELT